MQVRNLVRQSLDTPEPVVVRETARSIKGDTRGIVRYERNGGECDGSSGCGIIAT